MEDIVKNNNLSNNREKKYKIIIIILLVIIVVLLWQLITSKIKVKTIVIEKIEAVKKTEDLQSELDSLLLVHEQVKQEYGDLAMQLSVKDSIIKANAEEIQKLIAQQADYWRIKRKLNILRNITQGYIHQIDSLFNVNAALKEENVQIKKSYTQEKQKNIELIQEKENLSQKVSMASLLKAYNITATCLRYRGGGKKEEVTNNANKVEFIRICFTLSENKLTEPGPKTIYVRIARPDNMVLVKGKDDIYSFVYNGQRIQYSMKKEIDYQNKEMNICLSWEKYDKKEPAMKGTYNVAIFIDDYEIGQTSFVIN
ncbi:MAG TPA: hypothetical protein P5250_02575 [Bacteroidales bacterium]|nr:hypothetical protein [Bacteroidales bacterium]